MPFKYREIEGRLMKMGYRVVRQKGSHVIFSDGKNTFSDGRFAARRAGVTG
ncbi:type II toxin-antitoxin system HicA family toxin [Candidatus Thiosymbion oneisti]|uniref:type II toxin-antitoxin system HicA family toxin n=1 Tax=Candidatus Thiosymbion oneisti TaxID=589554 RepID=UPI00105B49BF